MRVLIIEDEIPAKQILMKFLGRFFPDFTIVGILDSVGTAVNFLRHQTPDLIFLDVELSDGKSFEIFRQVEIYLSHHSYHCIRRLCAGRFPEQMHRLSSQAHRGRCF